MIRNPFSSRYSTIGFATSPAPSIKTFFIVVPYLSDDKLIKPSDSFNDIAYKKGFINIIQKPIEKIYRNVSLLRNNILADVRCPEIR
jgi:hypothetical protein